jgi:hypothetical protein
VLNVTGVRTLDVFGVGTLSISVFDIGSAGMWGKAL